MINSLIRVPFAATLINANFNHSSYHHVVENDILLVLKESPFYVNHNDNDYAQYLKLDDIVAASISVIASSDIPSDLYVKTYDAVTNSLKKKQFVDGFEVLNLSTSKTLWVSVFDLEFLETEYKALC